MGQFFIVLALALVLGAVVFGVAVLIVGGDQGLEPVEPDGQAVPLPTVRPLTESDLARVRFDVAFRGYRMAQVDQALRRTAYDLGYKEELIGVLEAEVEALRDGRQEDADKLREARLAAAQAGGPGTDGPIGTDRTEGVDIAEATDPDADPDLDADPDFAEGDDPDRPRLRRPEGAEPDGAGPDGDRADRAAGVPIDLGIVTDAAAEPAK